MDGWSRSSSAAASRDASSWGSARRWRRRWRCPMRPRRKSRGPCSETEKPVLVWLEFQDCAGNTESFLRASRPTAAEVDPRRAVGRLSRDDHGGGRAPGRGEPATRPSRSAPAATSPSSRDRSRPAPTAPTARSAAESALDIAREVCGNAAATIAIGTCAAFGGIPGGGAEPDRRPRRGRRRARRQEPDQPVGVPGQRREPDGAARLLPHVQALAAARSATAGRSSPTASRSTTTASAARTTTPGSTSRRGATRATAPATASTRWAARGRSTFQNCPNVRWNGGTNWPIGCGHPCIGCAEPNFWDRMTPFYQHLTGVPGFGVGSNVDTIGASARCSASAPRSPATASFRS